MYRFYIRLLFVCLSLLLFQQYYKAAPIITTVGSSIYICTQSIWPLFARKMSCDSISFYISPTCSPVRSHWLLNVLNSFHGFHKTPLKPDKLLFSFKRTTMMQIYMVLVLLPLLCCHTVSSHCGCILSSTALNISF